MPRQAILQVLRDSRDLLSADDVYIAVRADYPGVGIATVYRTLQLLTDFGVTARVDTGDGKGRYKLAVHDQPLRHVVLNCRQCGRSAAVPLTDENAAQAAAAAEAAIGAANEFAVEQSVIQLVGVCSQCSPSASVSGGQ